MSSFIYKPKHPKSCYGCAAFIHRVGKSPPDCWLGEEIDEGNPFGPNPEVPHPARGECYKPLTNKDLIFVQSTFYDRKIHGN